MVSLTSYVLLSEPPASDSPHKDLKMYPKLEQDWSKIRFDAVDVLHIGPFNAWPQGSKYIFGIGSNCTEQNPAGDFKDRLEWVIKRARYMNPNIKIIAMQMHNDGDYSKLKNNIDDYTTSVAHLVKTYLNKTAPSPEAGKNPIKLHIDGYDVDYEWGGDDRSLGSGNYQTYAIDILAQVRAKITKVDPNSTFYVSISAADTVGIANTKVAQSLDYVKMQNYDGGVRDPRHYQETLKAGGLGLEKLVYGISSEWPSNNDYSNLADVVGLVKDKKYGGIMTWRLNSDNLLYESAAQVYLHNQFKTPKIKADHPDADVLAAWNGAGGMGGRNSSGKLVAPWKLN